MFLKPKSNILLLSIIIGTSVFANQRILKDAYFFHLCREKEPSVDCGCLLKTIRDSYTTREDFDAFMFKWETGTLLFVEKQQTELKISTCKIEKEKE